MKEISEELQMKVFDLLEGNLSEKEKAEVFNLIATSPELQREYQLMARTYLHDEEKIVFGEKHKLYRRSRLVIAWAPMMRYAAAVAILAVVGITAWNFFKNPSGNGQIISSNSKQNTIPTDRLGTAKIQPEQQARSESKKPENAYYYSDKKIKTESENINNNIESPIQKQMEPFKEALVAVQEITDPVKVENAENPVVVSVVSDTSNVIAEQRVPVQSRAKRSLFHKLNNSRQMLANLRLPDVRFRAEKNANRTIPTIKMEIRTLKTDVIATLID